MYNLKEKLQGLISFLQKYDVLPIIEEEIIEGLIWEKIEDYWAQPQADRIFDAKKDLFKIDILKVLAYELIPYKQHRIIVSSDWWLECPFEYNMGFREKLSLRYDLECSVFAGDRALMIEYMEDHVKIGYPNEDLVGKFPFRIGINTINHLLKKIKSERRIAEIVDTGNDNNYYIVLEKNKAQQFRKELGNYLLPGQLTEVQKDIGAVVLE
jgi:hypothetical protein